MNSIFESLISASQTGALWTMVPQGLNDRVIYAGNLLKHSRKEQDSTLVQRYFYLQGNYLVYKNSLESTKPSAAMHLKFVKLSLLKDDCPDVPSTQRRLAFKLSRGSKFTVLFANNFQELEQWINVLTQVTLRSDIHERFTIEKGIGAGSFAQVFRATEITTGRLFAVKGFNKSAVLQSPVGKESLWKEIEITRSISGKKNVVTLYEVHETKNSVYLIMELIEGGDFESFIRSSNNTPRDFVNIAYGLLTGLEVLSQNNVCHRDIKPTNVMLRKTIDITPEDVVIVDFGLAALGCDTTFLLKRCGTPGYIAPELISLKNAEQEFSIPAKADIYSAGVVLYNLCSREPLFDQEGLDCNQVLKANLQSKITFPKSKFQQYGIDSVDLLYGLLQAKPEKRASLRQALNHKAFYHFKEESLDSSIEENEFEDEQLPTVTQKVAPLLPCSLPPALRFRFSGDLGDSRRSSANSGAVLKCGHPESNFIREDIKVATTKETVVPYSPVTSHSNGISKANLGIDKCECFTRLLKESSKAINTPSHFKRLLNEGMQKPQSLGHTSTSKLFVDQ